MANCLPELIILEKLIFAASNRLMQPGDFRVDDAVEFLVKIVIDFIGLRANACLDHVQTNNGKIIVNKIIIDRAFMVISPLQ
jgi:hypothetical protein